jgi:hypothetical protein
MRKRRRPRPQPDRAVTLTPVLLDCPECRHRTQARYNNYRTISTLDGVVRLTLTIRRCPNPACPRFLRPYPDFRRKELRDRRFWGCLHPRTPCFLRVSPRPRSL